MNSQGFRSQTYPATTSFAVRVAIFGLVTALLPGLFLSAAPAGAAEPAAPAGAAEPEAGEMDESEAWETSLEFNFASAYIWRGLNLLGQGNQRYSPGVFLPGLSTTKGIWTIGYSGAFQLAGKNLASNMDAAAGAESDLYVEVEKTLTGDLSWTASLTSYFFPASKKAESGADRSLYAEPSLGLTWGKYFSPFFKIHWFHGVQSALADYDYVYFNVGGSRDVKLAQKLTLKLASEGGWKWFTGDDTVTDNAWDVQATAGLEWSAADELTLTLQAGAAWSNFAEKTFADEATAWLVAGACVTW